MKTESTTFESHCPQCGTPLPQDAPMGMCPKCLLAEGSKTLPNIPSVSIEAESYTAVGDYDLLEVIARGGMGVVYRARQMSLNRVVALKMILSGRLATENEVTRFRAEAEAAAHLRHPNIVAVFDVGETDGRHFYSMEFVEGDHLETRMQQGALPMKQAVSYMIKIARAVHFAHQRGVVHRDLKPQNILLDEHDQPRITDFGLAKRMDLDADLTLTGTVFGSPAYMAPEQAQGKQDTVGPLTDVYALGAILFRMIAGRPPFQASTPLETMKAVAESNPPSLITIRQDAPADLETICLKCLEKNPAQRYGSAQDLAEELERWMSNKPILARPSTAKERFQKWVNRNPLLVSMSSLVLLVGFIAFLVVGWQLQQTRSALAKAEQLIVAEATARAAVMEPYLILPHDGPVAAVSFSNNGEQILSASHDHSARLWNAQSGDVVRVFEGHEGVVGKAMFSPDEHQILTVSFDSHFQYPHLSPNNELFVTTRIPRFGDRSVRVWDKATGAQISVLDHANQVVDADFSPDGLQIVTASWDHQGRVWDVLSGKETSTLKYHQAALLSARFSPDGRQVITTPSGNDYQITIHPGGGGGSTSSVHEAFIGSLWDVESGELVESIDNCARDGFLIGGYRSSRSVAEFSADGQWIILSGGNPSNLMLWNVSKQRIEHLLKGHETELVGARFNTDSTQVISYGADKTARIWDVATGRQTALLSAHKDTVLWAEFNKSGSLVVTASGDGTARVWDASTGVGISVLKGHQDKVYQARFSPDGLRVVTASEDGTARLWDAATMMHLSKVFRGHERKVVSMDISPDGKHAVTGSADGKARLWDMESQETLFVLEGYQQIKDDQMRRHASGDVKDVRFSLDGQFVLTASDDSQALMRPVDMSGKPTGADVLLAPFSPLRKWRVQDGQLEKRFDDLPTGMQSIRWSKDGARFVAIPNGEISKAIWAKGVMGRGWSGSSEQLSEPFDLPVWESGSGRELFRIKNIIHELNDVAFSGDGKWMATADQGPVRLWDGVNGQWVKTLPGSEDAGELEFVNGARQLFIKDMRGANLWELESAQRVVTYPSSGIPFIDATFYENLELVLGWTQDNGMVCLFDMNSGKLLIQLNDVAKRLRKALLSPDGRLLVTIGWNKTPKVWDARTGELLESLEGHEDDVLDAVMSPDGRWLGTVSEDYTARLWPLNVIRTVR
ncbi:MAG: protein kinase [Verrucomicrobia bacterium]|nr:protein kinase [Verrucomicrobiota bacterium]